MSGIIPEAPQPDFPQKSRWLPTRKWGVAVANGVSALALMFVVTGTWDQEESVALIGLLTMAVSTYLIPNDKSNVNSP